MLGYALLYVCAGLLFMGVSIPLIQKRVRPNPIYGFRTAKTMGDPQIWYAANVRAGVLLFLAGVIIAGGAVLLAPLALLLKIGVEGYLLGCLTLLIVSTTWATVGSFLYLKSL